MKLVTGREFRFQYFGNDPFVAESEYGAIVKNSFEIFTGYQHSDTAYYDNTAAYPGRAVNYSGPLTNRADMGGCPAPILQFYYFGLMVHPNARWNPPRSYTINTATLNNAGRVRWRWTAGSSVYPYFDDIVIVDTGLININQPDPTHQGVGTAVANNQGSWNGVLYHCNMHTGHYPKGTTSGIFPPVDGPPSGANAFKRITDNVAQQWDGHAIMNLFHDVSSTGPSIEISSGWWRFVHLFCEML